MRVNSVLHAKLLFPLFALVCTELKSTAAGSECMFWPPMLLDLSDYVAYCTHRGVVVSSDSSQMHS